MSEKQEVVGVIQCIDEYDQEDNPTGWHYDIYPDLGVPSLTGILGDFEGKRVRVTVEELA